MSAGVKPQMSFSASSVRLEGFKVTTDLAGMCWITFLAAVAVYLLSDSCAAMGLVCFLYTSVWHLLAAGLLLPLLAVPFTRLGTF